ncbi:MAG: DUF2491 family protein [Magnetococcales bacterium]|nr:DUF2491 family protein [Magnetococcales bacterium]
MSFRIMSAVLKSRAEHLADKVKDQFKSDRPRMDLNLPLGLTIGGLVSFDETPFILSEGKISVTSPGTNVIVEAYGAFEQHGHKGHRFYLGQNGHMLQFLTDLSGEIIQDEIKLFQSFDQLEPPTPEEWDFWLADEDGSIGLNQFQTIDGVLYDRLWLPGAYRVAPERLVETVYSDPRGEHSVLEKHQSMLYARQCDEEEREYMLISAVRSGPGAWVEINVGRDVDISFITVV